MQSTFRWYVIRLHGKAIASSHFRKAVLKTATEEYWFSDGESEVGDNMRLYRRFSLPVDRITIQGTRERELITAVSWIDFSLMEGRQSSLLKVLNPGRNLRGLMMALEKAIGYGFSVIPITMEAVGIDSILRKFDVTKLVGLKVKDLVLGEDCVGRMELASKNEIDLSLITPLVGLTYKADYFRYELLYHGLRGSIACSSGGVMKVGGQLGTRIVELVERQLRRL